MTGHLRVNGTVVKLQHKQKAADTLIPVSIGAHPSLRWRVRFDEAYLLRNVMYE